MGELVGKKLTCTALSCPSLRQVTAVIWYLSQSNYWKNLKRPDDSSDWLSVISYDRHECFLFSSSANFPHKVITPAALWYLTACNLMLENLYFMLHTWWFFFCCKGISHITSVTSTKTLCLDLAKSLTRVVLCTSARPTVLISCI